jgi:hypothetical protein
LSGDVTSKLDARPWLLVVVVLLLAAAALIKYLIGKK